LLLVSNDVASAGIGNGYDNVGRYYMSHISGTLASVELRESSNGLQYGFDRDEEGVYIRRRLWLTPEGQARAGIGNGVALFHRLDIANAGHRNSLFSSTYLAKAYLGALRSSGWSDAWQRLRGDRNARKEHWSIVVRDFPHLAPEVLRLAWDRWFATRRLPMVLAEATGTRFELLYVTEHVPNFSSRLVVDRERDRFGIPRLQVNVAFEDLDVETVVGLHDAIAARLVESGVGRLDYNRDAMPDQVRDNMAHFNSGAHHLGTTRMASNPKTGVVDADGRVFGVDNLFVCGGSVFATGGHANPTLTIVALALRLSEHLKGKIY
jgi:hypothetical protein